LKKKLLVIAGPTASGKTEIVLALSRIFPLEVISADSMQVYRSMPIVTQAPSEESQKIARTHLVSFLPPSQEYNAARFRRDATQLAQDISARGKLPVVAGGTGLYIRALLDGLFDSETDAGGDEEFRKKLAAEKEEIGSEALHEKLAAVDPESAKKIHANDTRRVIRALEVYHVTGKPFSKQKDNRSGLRSELETAYYTLDPDRETLYARIDRRVDKMLADGLVEEVKKLRGEPLSRTAAMALGIREVKEYLEGRLSLEEAAELLRKNTRHYSRRQLSWFRHEKNSIPVRLTGNESAAEVAERIAADWQKETK
jgi:tRNA dimethylallyltransferase